MKFFFAFFVTLFSSFSWANCTLETKIDGVIGPGTVDYLERAEKRAHEDQCESILLLINTPGGNLQSTRLIVEQIVNSPRPWLCFVAPGGAHAGSAGAIILQACHVSGAIETTNIGAATPISGGGEKMGDDLRKKILNDTISWVESLSDLRGRDKQFAKDIVSEAKAVSAKEAFRLKAIDFVGSSLDLFLKFSEGRSVKMTEGASKEVKVASLRAFHPDYRSRLLDLLTHPQIAYLLFMGSIALLYFELTHPGIGVPGVVGAVGLVISLVSFHMLDVQWGGLLLMLLGLGFMIAEAFVPSFGALGIGGIASFIGGSLLLFEPASGVSIPLGTILPTAIGAGLAMMGLAYLAYQAHQRKKESGEETLVGHRGKVLRINVDSPQEGQVEILGEIWNYETKGDLRLGDRVVVTSVHEMRVQVEKV